MAQFLQLPHHPWKDATLFLAGSCSFLVQIELHGKQAKGELSKWNFPQVVKAALFFCARSTCS
jgi:hypothetical protein